MFSQTVSVVSLFVAVVGIGLTLYFALAYSAEKRDRLRAEKRIRDEEGKGADERDRALRAFERIASLGKAALDAAKPTGGNGDPSPPSATAIADMVKEAAGFEALAKLTGQYVLARPDHPQIGEWAAEIAGNSGEPQQIYVKAWLVPQSPQLSGDGALELMAPADSLAATLDELRTALAEERPPGVYRLDGTRVDLRFDDGTVTLEGASPIPLAGRTHARATREAWERLFGALCTHFADPASSPLHKKHW